MLSSVRWGFPAASRRAISDTSRLSTLVFISGGYRSFFAQLSPIRSEPVVIPSLSQRRSGNKWRYAWLFSPHNNSWYWSNWPEPFKFLCATWGDLPAAYSKLFGSIYVAMHFLRLGRDHRFSGRSVWCFYLTCYGCQRWVDCHRNPNPYLTRWLEWEKYLLCFVAGRGFILQYGWSQRHTHHSRWRLVWTQCWLWQIDHRGYQLGNLCIYRYNTWALELFIIFCFWSLSHSLRSICQPWKCVESKCICSKTAKAGNIRFNYGNSCSSHHPNPRSCSDCYYH